MGARSRLVVKGKYSISPHSTENQALTQSVYKKSRLLRFARNDDQDITVIASDLPLGAGIFLKETA